MKGSVPHYQDSFSNRKKMQLGSGTNILLRQPPSDWMSNVTLGKKSEWHSSIRMQWLTSESNMINIQHSHYSSIVINIQFVLGEFSFQSIHSTWDDHIVDSHDLQTWIYCKKVKGSHESITGPTWWAMMLSLWSEGCRLNSTTSPSIRCLSTISPY